MLTKNEKVELRKRIDDARTAMGVLYAANVAQFEEASRAEEAAWRELFRFIKEDL